MNTAKIPRHKDRKEIEQAIVAGETLRNVAKRAGVHPSTVSRHRARLPKELAESRKAADIASADCLLDKIGSLESEAHRIKQKAEDAGDLRTALAGIRELTRIVELLARVRGELQDQPAVNVLINPQWAAVRTVILVALDPYPAARVAVAAALAGMETPV
jgi:hypothetical protein